MVIIATGLEISESLKAAAMLKADGISAQVIDIHTIKPLDKEFEVLAEEAPIRMLRIGINDTFGESGTAKALLKNMDWMQKVFMKK